jgi:hypothetical protein
MSMAEKEQARDDPTVKEMLSLFGGEVVDMRKDAKQAKPDSQESEK